MVLISKNRHQFLRLKVLLITLLCPFFLLAQFTDLKFSHFSIEDGLSQNTINCMLKDDKGFIWIGTQDGLNRYDGYKFKIFRNEPSNTNSLSNNYIETIFQDNEGVLWIGTRNGLNKFNTMLNTFERFYYNDKDPTTISHNNVKSINQDKNGELWFGTLNGLNSYNSLTKKFRRHLNNPENENSISNDNISTIYFDENNTMWIGTRSGLNTFDKLTNHFKVFKHKNNNNKSISNNRINCLTGDSKGNLWIGTSNGLNKFDKVTKEFISFFNISNKENSVSNNLIQNIMEDDLGYLWIGTRNGLNKFDQINKSFKRYESVFSDPISISGNDIRCLLKDDFGMIWSGTPDKGINKFFPAQKKFNHFKSPISLIGNHSGNTVWAFEEDKYGNLWYGTYNGLYVYNPKTKQFRLFQAVDVSLESGLLADATYRLLFDKYDNLWIGSVRGLSRLNDNYIEKIWNKNSPINFVHFNQDNKKNNLYYGESVNAIYEDKKNNLLWVGTFSHGLFKIEFYSKNDDVNNITFTPYKHNGSNPNSISSNRINIIVSDVKDRLWVGTENGLDLMDVTNNIFKHYTFDSTKKNSISEKRVSHICLGDNDILWVGTYGGGLNKFTPQKETFIHYTIKDGLPNNYVYGTLIDNKKKLWLSTNNGISKFNPDTKTFRNYNVNDGLQSNEFNTSAFYKSKSGKLFFGGINGFNSFYPDSIKNNTIKPLIFLTELEVLNKQVKVGVNNNELGITNDKEIILPKNIIDTDTINLTYKHNIFSIEFTALHFQNPKGNKYAYQLEGFDDDWVYVSSENRKATYTNLPYESYLFKVKASNADGVWNEREKSMVINISPPYWRTNWFYFICGLLGFSIIYLIFKLRLNQAKLIADNLRIEERKEYFQKQNDEKKAMLKEIHHRVKNNLQVVNSLLKFQSREFQDEHTIAMFKEAQNRVLSMALLHEKMYRSDDLKHIDVREHITLLVEDLIKSYAVDKVIKLDIKIEKADVGIRTLVPLGLIINEIITNALKYAFKNKNKGKILVQMKHLEKNEYEMIIGDDGVGLKTEDKSTGIGAKLIKIFAKQLNGTLEQLKRPGTVFKFVFEKID